uniref:Uncharacterized protein n=1 Tax=Erpetoichthys calabaricus TaxID=27687 RepID=A0A8C4X6L1_ERPCA
MSRTIEWNPSACVDLPNVSTHDTCTAEEASNSDEFKKLQRFIAEQTSTITSSLEALASGMRDGLIAVKSDLLSLHIKAAGHENKIDSVKAQLEAFWDKMADLEDRSRRCNIRITGLPEGAEGDDPRSFLRCQLPVWLPTLPSGDIKIMRAHRISSSTSSSSAVPRTLIVHLVHFADRQHILQAARQAPAPQYRGSTLHFFPDFSSRTAQRRKAYTPIILHARAAGLQPYLLFPARLKLSFRDHHQTYNTPETASHAVAWVLKVGPGGPLWLRVFVPTSFCF